MGANFPQKLIRAAHIGKAFGDVRVLDNVSFDLEPGEIHILAGENGAGKSTLIKILAGIHKDYEGTLEVADVGLSVIHQEMSLIDSMSVEDNIFLGREKMRGPFVDHATQLRATVEACRALDLDIDFQAPVETYPMSVKNRIEIAKALSRNARILIMDEPTSALTRPECERFFELIKSLKARGCGIIYISHKMEEIYCLADRITVLRDGRWIGTAAASELPEAKFVNWMIGRDLASHFPKRLTNPGPVLLNVERFRVPNPAADALSGRPWLVEDVSLSVRAGEIVGIAGLQGSGNTELLNGLFGTYGDVVVGKIEVAGQQLTVRSPRDAIESDVALLTSDRKTTGLVLGMSIRENISLASLDEFSPAGFVNKRAEEKKARGYVKQLRIRSQSTVQEVGALSGGNQQKVVLAKWLESKPKVLLLDEPTRGVDVGAKHEIYELLNDLAASGMAIVLISTEMPELLGLSDRVLVMHRGKVTAEFGRDQATQEKVLLAAMGETIA